jgi:orotidine-5'-phosphate decarboxylase
MVYVLARTSNPSAGQFQDLAGVPKRTRGFKRAQPLDQLVARWAAERWPDGRVGLVVGATQAEELKELRGAVPGPGFLVPGVGAQGGDLTAAVRSCDGTAAPGVVNVSRGISDAARGPNWAAEAGAAARRWLDDLREAGATLGATS